jgi:hypothetical protein
MQIGGRLLQATHLDKSNYLANHKHREANKSNLTVFIRLFQGHGSCACFQGHSSLLVDPLDMTAAALPRFPVQGHILSTSGDALRYVLQKTTIFIVNSSNYLPWHPTTDFISSHELLAQDIQTDSMKLLKRIRLETVVTVNHQSN